MRVQSRPEAPPVQQVRIARPTDRLDDVVRFYRDGIGLTELARFADHAGYSGVVLGIPGADRQLEFTHHHDGSPGPAPTRDNLLVLYLGGSERVEVIAARLATQGHRRVRAENPFWDDHGAVTVEDPDGWRVVLMPRAGFEDEEDIVTDLTIDWYTGDRDNLRPLFRLAEDSAAEHDSSLRAGRVLVARSHGDVVGHLQLVDHAGPGLAEIKNMAVRQDLHGRGIGRRLVRDALARLAAEQVSTVLVATAAADLGNLRFYQRQGFRMRSIERDAFTAATGYPPDAQTDGVPLRDRVWLDLRIGSRWSDGAGRDRAR